MKVKEFYNRVDLNGGFDREVDDWKIIDIHQIPNIFLDNHEVDFYCCNDKEVFLLRLRNMPTNKFDIVKDENGFGYPTYLIAECPITKVDTILLGNILNEFMNLKN